MAEIRNIITVGDPLLKQPCQTVRRFGPALHALLDDMKVTMYEANGCGLAAPQVGISKRLLVADDFDKKGYIEMVNPEILECKGRSELVEHCLSVPGRGGLVARAEKVKVRAQDRYGEVFTISVDDAMARILQHEIDHLQGKLFLDVMIEEVPD